MKPSAPVRARDVMTTWVATIGAGASVREAAKLMVERGVSALPVLDDKHRVVGIAERLIAQAARLRPDTAKWSWEVQVIDRAPAS